MKTAVISCMKNEGVFVVEWVAYYRAIGFDEILVITNNCTDQSDSLLDRLEERGYVTHLRNQQTSENEPQVVGLKMALSHTSIKDSDWVLHIDADEFLNIDSPNKNIAEFVSRIEPCDAIAILWKSFGDAGHGYWNGGYVLPTFTKTNSRPLRRNLFHKTIFRPNKFASAIDHMPKTPIGDVVVKNSAGTVINNMSLYNEKKAKYSIDYHDCSWQNACINHYAIKSQDVFLMKNFRGLGIGKLQNKYLLNSTFYNRNNSNEVDDLSVMEIWDGTKKIIDEILADDATNRLNSICLDWFIQTRNKCLSPEVIVKLTKFQE